MIRLVIASYLCIFLSMPALSEAGQEFAGRDRYNPQGGWCREKNPEQCRQTPGGWCGKRRGDCYGERRPVDSVAEARKAIEQQYEGKGYTVSAPVERRWGYEAELSDGSGKVVDRVMVHRKSGRIRSLY